MAVSYAGVSLPTVTKSAAAWVSYALDTENIDLFQIRHDHSQTQSRLSIPNKEVVYKPRLGSLLWPTGASLWATGLYLATSTQLDAIKAVVYAGSSYTAAPLILDDETGLKNRSITTNMWLLPTYPVVQVPGQEALYLITLVDNRYWWWYAVASPTVVYGGTPTTYAALLQQVLSSIVVDTPDSAYLSPGMAHNGVNEYIALLLDSISYNCGQRIRVDLTGSVHSYTAATAATKTATNLALGNLILHTGGYLDDTELSGYLPHTVEVDFPTLDSGGTENRTTTTSGLNRIKKLFRSTGISTEDSVWSGALTTLQDFTNKFAADWYSWQLAKVEATYCGIVDWNPMGLESLVEWTFRDDIISTRISRGPIQDLTEDLLHAVSIGFVVLDGLGGRVNNVNTILVSGASVSSGVATTPQNVAEITIVPSGSAWTTQNVTTNPTITFNSGGSLTLNGPIGTCSNSVFTFGGQVSNTPYTFTVTNSQNISTPTTNYGIVTTVSGTPEITGVTPPSGGQPFIFTVTNNSGSSFTLVNNSGSAPTNGQIITSTGSDLVVSDSQSFTLQYDPNTSSWFVVSTTSFPSSGPGSLTVDDNHSTSLTGISTLQFSSTASSTSGGSALSFTGSAPGSEVSSGGSGTAIYSPTNLTGVDWYNAGEIGLTYNFWTAGNNQAACTRYRTQGLGSSSITSGADIGHLGFAGYGAGTINDTDGYSYISGIYAFWDGVSNAGRLGFSCHLSSSSWPTSNSIPNASSYEFQISTNAIGFFNTSPVTQQSSASLTNNVTAGGSTNVIADITDLVIYANDANDIRNDIYQLAKKIKEIGDGLRSYGLFS